MAVTDDMGGYHMDTVLCTMTAKPWALSIENIATLLTMGGAIVGGVGWMFRIQSIWRKRRILFDEHM